MAERSLSDLLRDIGGNIHAMIRSEILLAKTELREEIRAAKGSAVFVAAGVAAALAAALFVLIGAMYALERVMPPWSAALLVAAGMVVLSTALFGVARTRMRLLSSSTLPQASTMKGIPHG